MLSSLSLNPHLRLHQDGECERPMSSGTWVQRVHPATPSECVTNRDSVRGHQHKQKGKKGEKRGKRKPKSSSVLNGPAVAQTGARGSKDHGSKSFPPTLHGDPRHPRAKAAILPRPISLIASSSRMLRAALASRFQKFALHRLMVQRKTFRVNLSAIFLLASMVGAPDEGQFDTALSQSAWIRAPLGQARLVLVLAAPGADRHADHQTRPSSVLSRSVVTRRVMNEVHWLRRARRRDGWAAQMQAVFSVRW
jgi:hypothetical protein